MGIFKRLSQLLSPAPSQDQRAFWLNVQCSRCGEKIQARVDLYNDLSPVYEEKGTTYFCRKVIMGQQHCYQKIEVEMTFDGNRKLLERHISGGQFVSDDASDPKKG